MNRLLWKLYGRSLPILNLFLWFVTFRLKSLFYVLKNIVIRTLQKFSWNFFFPFILRIYSIKYILYYFSINCIAFKIHFENTKRAKKIPSLQKKTSKTLPISMEEFVSSILYQQASTLIPFLFKTFGAKLKYFHFFSLFCTTYIVLTFNFETQIIFE